MNRMCINIAGLKISLQHDNDPEKVLVDRSYDSFFCDSFKDPEITFRLDTEAPFTPTGQLIQLFTSQPDGLWTIYEDAPTNHYVIALNKYGQEKAPFVMVRADRLFSDFIIYERSTEDTFIVPLRFPVAELAVAGHININHIGILLHAAGISFRGKGYLFAGTSGTGKSTIAGIWQEDRDATVLTDERVVIRDMENDLLAFGTPWHGTAEMHKNIGAPIDTIFFIEHGRRNDVRQISKRDALNRLVVRCFPTFWNRAGMEFVLQFCERIVSEKRCYELRFVPDGSITDFIKKTAL